MRTTKLLEDLIRFPSITPDTTNALDFIAEMLEPEGFRIEFLEYEGVRNLYAKFGDSSDVTLLLGHTDVVPTGDETKWTSPAFKPEVRGGYMYGRGAADMKGGVSALICAALEITQKKPEKTIAILLTADEEGVAENGVKKAARELAGRGENFKYCIVAEPSSSEKLGDTIRVGRRGSLHLKLKVIGKQGHVAFAENALNPIHTSFQALEELTTKSWEEDSSPFPPTSFQISNIEAGTGADNVIPGELNLVANFRFGTAQSAESLTKATEAILDNHNVNYEASWRVSAEPFLSPNGKLTKVTTDIIRKHMGYEPELSTGGGTSDARFIAPLGAEIIELGVVNKTSHQIDECVLLEDLEALTRLFSAILERI